MKKTDIPGLYEDSRGKLYRICADCNGLVRIDKFLFGSLHICVDQTKIHEENENKP